jgi:DNA gyrase subunit A
MISRTSEDKSPRLSGVDAPTFLVRASTHDTLYLVTANGKSAAIAVHTLPQSPTIFNKTCPLKADEIPVCAFALPALKSALPEETYVFTTTRGGMVKKSAAGELPGPSSQTFWLCKVNDGDALGWVALTDGKRQLLLATALGMAIRFDEDEVRPMGLVAAGVNAVKLGVGDEVVGAEVVNGKTDAAEVFLIGSDGRAKRIAVKDFPSQGRYGRGVIAWDLPLGVKLAGIATGKPKQHGHGSPAQSRCQILPPRRGRAEETRRHPRRCRHRSQARRRRPRPDLRLGRRALYGRKQPPERAHCR